MQICVTVFNFINTRKINEVVMNDELSKSNVCSNSNLFTISYKFAIKSKWRIFDHYTASQYISLKQNADIIAKSFIEHHIT